METYKGKAHLPGADREWDIDLELDWDEHEANIHIPEAPGGVTTWPGLMVQTFGKYEIAFRTKGIPPKRTHWWHLVRMHGNDLFGIIVGRPEEDREWATCAVELKKAS